MYTRQMSRLLSKTVLFAMLAATTACDQMNDMFGDDSATTAPKVVVKSPNAAPVQSVNAQEISSQGAVELGSMSDPSLTPAGTPRIVPLPPQGQAVATAPQAPVIANAPPATQAPMDDEPVYIDSNAKAAVAQAPVLAQTPDTPQGFAPTTAAAPQPAPANSVALLTVRFNQPHVYYDDALTSAVKQSETLKPGMVQYDVLSTVPDLSSLAPDQQAKLASRAKDNLRNVVVKLQQLGVQADRIRIAEQTMKIRSQEIQVYVR